MAGGEEDDYGDEEGEEGALIPGVSPEVAQSLQALVSNPTFPAIREKLLTEPEFSVMFMQNLQ